MMLYPDETLKKRFQEEIILAFFYLQVACYLFAKKIIKDTQTFTSLQSSGPCKPQKLSSWRGKDFLSASGMEAVSYLTFPSPSFLFKAPWDPPEIKL